MNSSLRNKYNNHFPALCYEPILGLITLTGDDIVHAHLANMLSGIAHSLCLIASMASILSS